MALLRSGLLLFTALVVFSACGDESPKIDESQVLRVSVLEDGQVLVDGQNSNLVSLRRVLEEHAKAQGVVWYYRANATSDEPHPNAMEVIALIVEYQLPISLSGTADFSTVVGPDGSLQPRN